MRRVRILARKIFDAVRHAAHIALGSNVGDRAAALLRALDLLRDPPTIRVEAVSLFHKTASVGGPADAGDYLNAAARLTTTLDPWQLLARLMAVEFRLGRRRPDRLNAPRPIDLDLLLYGDLILNDPRLTLPHPRLHERRFVLEPLAEVSPALRHPVLAKAVAELLAKL